MAKILVIDDNKDFLDMLGEFFRSEGNDVRTLSDPHRTEESVDEFNPDIIIIDVFMPERSGFNIVEDFAERGIYLHIPKIFLTGLDDAVEKMTAKAIGVAEYITKPVNPSELLKIVDNLLNPPVGIV